MLFKARTALSFLKMITPIIRPAYFGVLCENSNKIALVGFGLYLLFDWFIKSSRGREL